MQTLQISYLFESRNNHKFEVTEFINLDYNSSTPNLPYEVVVKVLSVPLTNNAFSIKPNAFSDFLVFLNQATNPIEFPKLDKIKKALNVYSNSAADTMNVVLHYDFGAFKFNTIDYVLYLNNEKLCQLGTLGEADLTICNALYALILAITSRK